MLTQNQIEETNRGTTERGDQWLAADRTTVPLPRRRFLRALSGVVVGAGALTVLAGCGGNEGNDNDDNDDNDDADGDDD